MFSLTYTSSTSTPAVAKVSLTCSKLLDMIVACFKFGNCFNSAKLTSFKSKNYPHHPTEESDS